jgi:hypothetical protein
MPTVTWAALTKSASTLRAMKGGVMRGVVEKLHEGRNGDSQGNDEYPGAGHDLDSLVATLADA